MYLYYVFLCIYILQKKDIFTNVWVCWGDLRVLFSHPNLDHVTEAAPLLGTISPFLFWLAGVPFLFCVMFTMFHVFSALPSHRFPACIPRCAVDRNTGLLESREFWPDNGISLCPRHCETLHYIIGSLSAIISSLAQWFKPKQRDTHFAGLISSPPSNYWHKAPLWAHTVLLPLKQHMTTQAYKDKRRPVTQKWHRRADAQTHDHENRKNCLYRYLAEPHIYEGSFVLPEQQQQHTLTHKYRWREIHLDD